MAAAAVAAQPPSRERPLRASVIPKALARRAGPQVDSKKLDAAKLGDELSIVRLLRTASGTTRAQTADDTWVTATTRDGKKLLRTEADLDAVLGRPQEEELVEQRTGDALDDFVDRAARPRAAQKVEVAWAAPSRAELRARLAATPFLEDPKHGSFMHGRAYDGPLTAEAAPTVTWRCARPPRDDHDAPKWLTATEFRDTRDVARRKVQQLAAMMRASKKTVIYSGAGISASVIGQAARSGQNKQGWEGRRHEAKPTFTHQALGLLVREGLVETWIQQNHDGLPQKASVPQEKINEIHGSWYDPSNPVVKYSGTLHDKYVPWMVDARDTADLVLVLGTSLGGLYADQVATHTAQRSCEPGEDAALGSVMINLQQTPHDGKMSLRLFGTTDDMLALLLAELGLGRKPRFQAPRFPKENRVLVPYDKDGRRLEATPDGQAAQPRMWLDLSPGSAVRIAPGHNIQGARQPAFMHIGAKCVCVPGRVVTCQCAASKPRQLKGGGTRKPGPGHGTVIARDDAASSFRLEIEGATMRLGLWWLDSAMRGAVETIPVVNLQPQLEGETEGDDQSRVAGGRSRR